MKLLKNLTNYRRRVLRLSTAFILLILGFSSTFAQRRAAETNTVAGNEEIRGTVKLPPGDTSGISATVILRSLSSPDVRSATDQEGNFRFSHLRPDSYTIIIDAGDGYEKASETVTVGFSGPVPGEGNPFSHTTPAIYQVRIYLQPKGIRNIETAAVPFAVRKQFQQALEDQGAGKHVSAIANLKTVIVRAPSFTLAYLELGKEYLKTGEGQLAIDTFSKALKFDPEDPVLRLNYGVALLNQKQYSAAETELRLSIQKGKTYSIAANYYLGVALLTEHKIDEARTVFESVVKNGGDKLPLVHRYLGGIYLQAKQYLKATDELNTYLKLEPKAADAEKIRATIKESRTKADQPTAT